MAPTYTPRYTLANMARPANPTPPSPPSSRSPSPRAPAWQTACWRRGSGSGDLPTPTRTPSPPHPHSRHSQAANYRRGSGDLPSPPTTPPSSSPPRSLRNLQAGNWRSSAGPPLPPPSPEWVVGRVVLLPNQLQVPTPLMVNREIPGAPWDHPHVITKAWEEHGVKLVKVRTCTSFGGEGIARKKAHHRHYFVEADKSRLTSESDAFGKQTYVNCSPGSEFTIEYDLLLIYHGKGKGAIQFSATTLAELDKNEPF